MGERVYDCGRVQSRRRAPTVTGITSQTAEISPTTSGTSLVGNRTFVDLTAVSCSVKAAPSKQQAREDSTTTTRAATSFSPARVDTPLDTKSTRISGVRGGKLLSDALTTRMPTESSEKPSNINVQRTVEGSREGPGDMCHSSKRAKTANNSNRAAHITSQTTVSSVSARVERAEVDMSGGIIDLTAASPVSARTSVRQQQARNAHKRPDTSPARAPNISKGCPGAVVWTKPNKFEPWWPSRIQGKCPRRGRKRRKWRVLYFDSPGHETTYGDVHSNSIRPFNPADIKKYVQGAEQRLLDAVEQARDYLTNSKK